jgi:streptomycin 6-kinase
VTAEGGPGWQSEAAKGLERVAHEVALDWELRLGPRYEWASHSFAAPAGDDAVLKVTPSEDDDADHEGDALAFWNGRGAVRLFKRDVGRRALLIERCVPGHDASAIAEHEAIRVALDTGRELWRPVTRGPFRRAGDEMARSLRALEQRSLHPYVPIATKLFASMSPRHDVLVHGDFHHHNLLRHTGRWLAIDPKPLIAEPEFDVVTLLWNPLQREPTREGTERRIQQFVSAGLDERRIRDWAIVRGTQLGLPVELNQAASARRLSVVYWLLE